jgi:hypothetical protein
MKLLSTERSSARAVPTIVQQRWRWAALAGVIVFLALAAFAIAVESTAKSSAPTPVSVLAAATDIRAGTTITGGMLRVTSISTQDSALLLTLATPADRSRLVGQTASLSIPAGSVIPAGIVSPQATGNLWVAGISVKRMPAGLTAGDHVALLAESSDKSGQPVDFVFMQDVDVAHVAANQVDLWLPAKVVPQVEWYADHGGLVLLKMPPGVVQQDLPAASGP